MFRLRVKDPLERTPEDIVDPSLELQLRRLGLPLDPARYDAAHVGRLLSRRFNGRIRCKIAERGVNGGVRCE